VTEIGKSSLIKGDALFYFVLYDPNRIRLKSGSFESLFFRLIAYFSPRKLALPYENTATPAFSRVPTHSFFVSWLELRLYLGIRATEEIMGVIAIKDEMLEIACNRGITMVQSF
jgi:hypothetical protein